MNSITSHAADRLRRNRQIMRDYQRGLKNIDIARRNGVSIATVNRVIRATKDAAVEHDVKDMLTRLYEREIVRTAVRRQHFLDGYCHGFDEGLIAQRYQARVDIRAIKQRAPVTPDQIIDYAWLKGQHRRLLWVSK